MTILCLFDYQTFTGFATVSKNLIDNWVKHYGDKVKIDIVAVNYFGEDYNPTPNVRVVSGKLKDIASDDFGRYAFMRSLRDKDYDLIFILQDLGVITPCIKFLKEIKKEKEVSRRKTFKSIFYFPVDFALTPKLVQGIEFFDYLATYTQYGKSQVLKLVPKVEKKLHIIPHGNNMEDFFPMPEEEITTFRNEYFGQNANKFIVCNINRNQPRKDIPNTIFGFLEYWEEYNKDSFLYLHMNPKDPMGWDVKSILMQTPLVEGRDYMFPKDDFSTKATSVMDMNRIYNSCDVYLTTATGGGWELSVTESMATKLPVILPNHTSLGELCNNGERGYLLQSLYPCVAIVDSVIRFQSDLYEIAETIDEVKRDIDSKSPKLNNKVEKAYEFIEKLSWEGISKTFIKAINKLVKE
jgi:glycosyltransferase involved in cell wall biosynthesis